MTGIELIAEERRRQIRLEGFTPVGDKGYQENELVRAAVCYALGGVGISGIRWPFSQRWWKPGSRVRNLAKAGALIAAEIDRVQAKR